MLIEHPIVLPFRGLGRNSLVTICLCFVDTIYVPLRVDECSLSLGLHPIHLWKEIEVDAIGSKEDVAREGTQCSECFVKILFDSWVGRRLARCIEKAVLRERPPAANNDYIAKAACGIA
jgi:hypothetical protein